MAKGAMGSNPPRTTQQTPEQLGLRRLSNKRYLDGKGNLTDANGKIIKRADKVQSSDLGLTRLSQGIYQDMDGNRTDNKGNILPRDNKGNLQIGRPSQPPPPPPPVQPTPVTPPPPPPVQTQPVTPPPPPPVQEQPVTPPPPPVQQQPAPVEPAPVQPAPVQPAPLPEVPSTPPAVVQDTTGATGGMVGNMGQRDERKGGAFGTNPTERNANPIYTAEGLFGSAGQFYTAENPKNIGSMVQPQFTQQMQQAGDAIYNEFTRRAEPEFERQRAALEQQMYERGLDPNSQGARLQMDQLMQQQNDARQSIRNQATQQAMAYQQQLFGQGQTIYGMPANIAATLGAPYLENLKAQTELQGRRELFQFEEGQQAREIEAENVARRENFANDLTKLATQFGNDERLLAQDIEGKLRLGNFDLEADLKKLAASSDNAVRELAVQLQNDLAKIKASGAMDLKLAKVQG